MRSAVVAAAYLLGSIPFSYLVARRRGVDVRTVGSGNVGATNVMRSVGRGAGPARLRPRFPEGRGRLRGSAALRRAGRARCPRCARRWPCSATCIPVWLRFRGGKGVATGAGAFLPLAPVATLAALVDLRRGAGRRPLRLGGLHRGHAGARLRRVPPRRVPTSVVRAAAGMALLIVWKHRANLERIARGTENRLGARRPTVTMSRSGRARRRLVGHGAGRAPRARGRAGAAVGARPGAWRARSTTRARQPRLPARRHPAPGAGRDRRPRPRPWPGRRACSWSSPPHICRAVYRRAAPLLAPGAVLVSATKGLETDTLQRMTRGGGGGSARPSRWPCCRAPPSRWRWRGASPPRWWSPPAMAAVAEAVQREVSGRHLPRLHQRRRGRRRAGGRAQERDRDRGRHPRTASATATTPRPRSSRAAWRRSPASRWRWAAAPTPWPASPAWATSSSPARARSRATARSARRWAPGARWRRRSSSTHMVAEGRAHHARRLRAGGARGRRDADRGADEGGAARRASRRARRWRTSCCAA